MAETDSAGRAASTGSRSGIETFQRVPPGRSRCSDDQPDRVICHQVGPTHQRAILDAIGIPAERDFTTFRYLGNIGTVSLPITAAIADEREFLQPGRPGRLPRHRQRPELPDAGGGLVTPAVPPHDYRPLYPFASHYRT